MEHDQNRPKPRIAILAVHGVADQQRYATQRAAADLLLAEKQDTRAPSPEPLYENFTEFQTIIAQKSVTLARTINIDATEKQCRGLQGLSTNAAVSRLATYPADDKEIVFCKRHNDKLIIDNLGTDNSHLLNDGEWTEHESMREQLQGFDDKSDTHTMEIKVLSGERRETTDHPAATIDIFEAHWSDLSRVGNNFFSFLFEFYLLLYFLPRIGTLTLERARPYAPGKGIAWRVAFLSHLLAEYLTVIVVPILHLCLLSLGVTVLPFIISQQSGDHAGGNSIALLLLLSGGGIFLIHRMFKHGRKNDKYWHWLFVPVAAIAATVVALYSVIRVSVEINTTLTHVCFCLLLWGLIYIYDKRQPGAKQVGTALLGLAVALLVILQTSDTAVMTASTMIQHVSPRLGTVLLSGLDTASLHNMGHSAEYILAQKLFMAGAVGSQLVAIATVVAITLFVLFALVSFLAAVFIVRNTPQDQHAKNHRLFQTSTTSLVVSGLLSILITFSLWELIYQGTEILFGNYYNIRVVPDTLVAVLEAQFLPGLPYIAATVLAAAGFAAWVICPAPLSDGVKESEDTAGLGKILDRGFRQMNYASWALMLVLFVMIPISALHRLLYDPPVDQFDHYLVLGLAILIVALMFGHGPIEKVKKGFGAVLDIALDVTNWFRVRPRRNNAKAAICRRYVSLLRHIANWRDPQNGQPYDGLVIVAHSQGTVITADLLRFLEREQALGSGATDKSLQPLLPGHGKARIPMHFLSFGSPLRQLYNHRFPHQYQWCDHNNETDSGPDPASLGLASWHNLYMSGDYVGRYLWSGDDDVNRYTRHHVTTAFNGTARESCTGFGGHTKYWSGQVQPVNRALDKLIATVIESKTPAA